MRTHLYLLPLMLLPACKDSAPQVPEGVSKAWEQARSAVDKISPEVQQRTSGEVEKLFVFEYHVEDIESGRSADELKERLTALGRDRWDCFHIEPQEQGLRVFCKRNPKTFLKYIPRIF